MLKACQQHLDIMDIQLLDFVVKWAGFEIADLADDTAWKEMTQMSSKIFQNTVLLQANDDDQMILQCHSVTLKRNSENHFENCAAPVPL